MRAHACAVFRPGVLGECWQAALSPPARMRSRPQSLMAELKPDLSLLLLTQSQARLGTT